MITTTFPLQTRSESNARYGSRYQRSSSRKGQRKTTESRCREAFGEPPAPPLHITLVRICPSRNKVRDSLNMSGVFKAVADGLCDWLCINDSNLRLRWELRQENGDRFAIRIELRGTEEVPCFYELPLLAVTDIGRTA